jgi:GNAT superfamily N-acetyltransferase
MDFTLLEPGDDAYAELNARLVAFNREQVDWSDQTFTVVLRDEDGAVRGGARGFLRMGAVEVRGVWLDPDLRRTGLGRQLMARLEREATASGASAALLDTYEFQARGFYEGCGYRVFAEFDYPTGLRRFYLTKAL